MAARTRGHLLPPGQWLTEAATEEEEEEPDEDEEEPDEDEEEEPDEDEEECHQSPSYQRRTAQRISPPLAQNYKS